MRDVVQRDLNRMFSISLIEISPIATPCFLRDWDFYRVHLRMYIDFCRQKQANSAHVPGNKTKSSELEAIDY